MTLATNLFFIMVDSGLLAHWNLLWKTTKQPCFSVACKNTNWHGELWCPLAVRVPSFLGLTSRTGDFHCHLTDVFQSLLCMQHLLSVEGTQAPCRASKHTDMESHTERRAWRCHTTEVDYPTTWHETEGRFPCLWFILSLGLSFPVAVGHSLPVLDQMVCVPASLITTYGW